MQKQEEAQEQQAHHVTAEGDALPRKVWVMNTTVTPTSGTITSTNLYIDLNVSVSARDLALHQGYELSADEMGKVVCLADVGGDELPRGAAPSSTAPWVYEAVNPQPNRVTLRVRAEDGAGSKTLCVRTRAAAPQHPGGWHDSSKDNLDGGVHRVQLTGPVLRIPIAATPWNTNETMYFWGDGTHSCYSGVEGGFYKNKYGFDARGMRRNDTLAGWPAGNAMNAIVKYYSDKGYIFWHNNTYSDVSTQKDGFFGRISHAQSNILWSGYPSGKNLIGVLDVTRTVILFFWQDGTHSGYVVNDSFIKGSSDFDANGYRPNRFYGLPVTKIVNATESLGSDNCFRVFWHDGTHSHIDGGLVTNRDGFDAQGYRSNNALPGWAQLT